MSRHPLILVAVFLLSALAPSPSHAGVAEPGCITESYFTQSRISEFVIDLSSNNVNGTQIAAQLFEAPEPVTLFGFNFYGMLYGENDPAVTVTASVYLPDDDGFPTGTPLATTTVVVDDRIDSSLLDVLQIATFPTPVVVDQPYLLVLENDSADSYGLFANDFRVQDGQGEGLASVYYSGSWRNGLDASYAGGHPFDADFLLLPRYGFDLTADFSSPDACLDGAGQVQFLAEGSPILTSRFYNFGISGAFRWDFGDNSSVVAGPGPAHNFDASGPWQVTMNAVLSPGVGPGCAVTVEKHVGAVPQGLSLDAVEDFATYAVQFSAAATGADSWSWTFGDSATSTEQNPTHTYAELGFHNACVDAANLCGAAGKGSCVQVLSPYPDLNLSLSADNMASLLAPGAQITYDIVVANPSGAASGPQALSHDIPDNLIDVTWTCSVDGTGSCTSAGSDGIDELVLVDPQSSLTYTVTGTFAPAGLEPLSLAATVATPTGDTTDDNSAELMVESSAFQIFLDGFETGDTSAWTSADGLEPAAREAAALQEPVRSNLTMDLKVTKAGRFQPDLDRWP